MRELVLPFTCVQAKWVILLMIPAVFLAGIITMNFPMIFFGGIFGGIFWLVQITMWWADGEFNVRCKCE